MQLTSNFPSFIEKEKIEREMVVLIANLCDIYGEDTIKQIYLNNKEKIEEIKETQDIFSYVKSEINRLPFKIRVITKSKTIEDKNKESNNTKKIPITQKKETVVGEKETVIEEVSFEEGVAIQGNLIEEENVPDTLILENEGGIDEDIF